MRSIAGESPTSCENVLSIAYDAGGKEGQMAVPGAMLHYRVAGSESAGVVVVLENGWGGLFPYGAWLEQAMAPHVRFISYNRAGIGESSSTEPITTARLTEQVMALLDGLGVAQPAVFLGHSYGGLIAALHAAQAPDRVRAVIQVDPTPEYRYDADSGIDHLPRTARFTEWALRLGFTGFVSAMYEGLPADAVRRMTKSRGWMADIIEGSIPESRLFRDMQRVVQASDGAKRCPRLVISASSPALKREGLIKLLLSQEKVEAVLKAAHEIHQRQARLNDRSRWISLPFTHHSILAHRDGAERVASHVREFMLALS